MKKKPFFSLILVLGILLSGCHYEVVLDGSTDQVSEQGIKPSQPTTQKAEPVVGFSATNTDRMSQWDQMNAEELQNYSSKYSVYNSYTYFEHLNDPEKLLYHAYEYALDHGFSYIWADQQLLSGMERTEFQVLEFLSLDSAVMEQNIYRTVGEYDRSVTWIGNSTYTRIFVEDFNEQRLKHKKTAIMHAMNVVYNIEDYQSCSKRYLAERFYEHLGGAVDYQEDVPNDEYLYNGLHNGRTNCDGYTNAFALMCAVVNIPCIEVKSSTSPGQDGHTWNMVYLEGKWVHVDATGAGEDVWTQCDSRNEHWVSFGYSDALVADRILYADLLPDCHQGLNHVLYLPSHRNSDFFTQVYEEFERNNREFAIVLLGTASIDDQTMDDLVSVLGCDLYYLYYQTVNDQFAYFLYNDG